MSGPELIEGRFVRLACPWCRAITYAVPGTSAMACASHARAWFGAAEPARPVPGANNALPLGQAGAACYVHTPRAWTGLEGVAAPLAPFVLVPRRPVREVDGAPSTVAALARVERGDAWYWAALWQEGAVTRKAGRTAESGKAERVATPPLDRWLLEETILVAWRRDDGRGFRLWTRRGRGRWVVACTWRRGADGSLRFVRGPG